MTDNTVAVVGEFVLQNLFSEFTYQVNRKIDGLLAEPHHQDSKQIMKSLQRGEDAQFDQLLGALGCLSEHCLSSLLDTLFKWFEQSVPAGSMKPDGKSSRSSMKSKSDSSVKDQDVKKELREMVISIIFCLVLIEVLEQLPVHPLPEHQIQHILSLAFTQFRRSAICTTDAANSKARIVAELFAEVIGVMAKAKFQHVRVKFITELQEAKKSEHNTRIILGLIWGMKFFRVKMYPVEDFEDSFKFLRELADYSLEVKDREVKHGLASLFVEILVPVAAAVKTEVNVPVLRDFVDALYPTSLELSRRRKNQLAMYPLVTCLLCVSQKQFFLNNWHIFLDNCLSNLKNRDQKVSRVALESLYRLLWAYTVRIKCESNTTTQSRLQSIIKTLFPVGSRSIVPKDTPLSIYVKIIQFIAQERLDFAMKEIVLDLLCISLSSSRNTKITTLQPERMNIGLRAFLVITDSLQQKDGAPPMPTTVGVMPSGNTLRVKKTFLNKMLTEDEARTIGVLQYHKHVQKALDGILVTLDGQVGQRMMMTNRTSDVIGAENKPKIDLFRTCIAAMPRLIPAGSMSQTELFELLSRLTIHIDDDLRSQAFTSLLSFAQDFPDMREDVVATFVNFVLKQVTDNHHLLLDTAIKHLMQLVSSWRSKTTHHYSNASHTSRPHLGKVNENPERRNKYAPLINHLEGFGLVLLCSNRSATRKLACLLLKEVKVLSRTLQYKKQNSELCIDALDRLCPVVASEVIIDQEIPHHLSASECKNVLAVSEKCDLTALVESASACSSHYNIDLWTSFIASFMKPNRIPTLCPSVIEFAWPNVNVRLNQLWLHMDPVQSSNKKAAASLPNSGEALLALWTNYVVFACRCAPTNSTLTKKQASSAAIPAGTPDWLVALLRDSERITYTTSALFQRLITVLRMESNIPLRDSAVVGLGSTSTTALPDLMIELMTVIHEASKPHRQDNMRRKRKRDNARVMLSRVLERLARHKVLSEAVSSDLRLPSQPSKTSASTIANILLDYIKDTSSFLESVDKTEFSIPSLSANLQQPQQSASSPFPGTLISAGTSVQTQPNTPNLMDDFRIHFGSMITHLLHKLPEHSQVGFLPNEIRRVLFFLFGRWCGKYCDSLDDLDALEGKQPANVGTLLHVTALRGECAVLCCGPAFDKTGLSIDRSSPIPTYGYLYPWLESMLDYANPKINQYAKEAIVLLLRHNRESELLSWLIDKCYTGSPLVSSGCFCSIASAFNYIDLCMGVIALLNLALFNIAKSEVSQTAQHLLMMIRSRIVQFDKMQEIARNNETNCSNDKDNLLLCLNVPCDGVYSPRLYSLSQYDISQDLARLHPEFTIAMLSEIFQRLLLTTTTTWQQLMLQYMLPWLRNVELTLRDVSEKIPELSNFENMYSKPLYMLCSNGWGSVEATLFVLSNLTYITLRFHDILGNEIEKCWSTLCETWPGNLDVLLLYTGALSACGGCKSIYFITRKLITFFARAKSKEVAHYLVKECQAADLPSFEIKILDNAPYLKLEIKDMKALNRVRPIQSASPRSTARRKKKSEKNVLSSSAPTSYMRISAKSDSASILHPAAISNVSASMKHHPLSKHHHQPHHMSLQQLNVSKVSDVDASPSRSMRPLSYRGKKSGSLYSLPTLSNNTGLSVSPKSSSTVRFSPIDALGDRVTLKDNKLRTAERATGDEISSPRHNQTNETTKNKTIYSAQEQSDIFSKWRMDIDSGYPCSLPLSTTPLHYLKLSEYFVLDPIHKSNGLLRSNIACVMLSEVVTEHGVVIDWKAHLPVLLLSLFLAMDVEYEQVPQKCQSLLAHIMIQLLSPKDQTIFASSAILDCKDDFFEDMTHSLSHLKRGTSPSSVCTTDSGIESATSPRTSDHPLMKLGFSMNETSNRNLFDMQTLTSFIQRLLAKSHGELWPCEDASPKTTVLKSTEQLTAYVPGVVCAIGSLVPDFSLSKKLAKQALKFSSRTSNKHCACRALQVFRSLGLPLRQSSITELSLSLSECIADGNDLASQSWAIEILLTFLQTCEMSPESLIEEGAKPTEKQQKAQTEKQSSKNIDPVTSTPPLPASASQSPSVPIKSKGKVGRRGHVHRRSGSVSISKQLLEEVRSAEPELPTSYESSPVSSASCSVTSERPSDQKLVTENNSNSAFNKSRSTATLSSAEDEWKNGLAQMFWMAVGILESDYEHEYLIALHIIQRVLKNLKLSEPDGRARLERSFHQIQWHNYKDLQSLLLKGLTCNTTCEAAFNILLTLTTVTHLPLVSPYQDGSGFAVNVIALLPRLINQFGDPDFACCECAQNIVQVSVDFFQDYVKLKSLAHVMSLYSNSTYNKSVQTWVNAVCKYVYETFPQALFPQITFLTEMLEKGHSSFHQATLFVALSLLSFSTALTDEKENRLVRELLHVVSKHLNGKHWKDALNILKLAVSRSSQLASPASAFIVAQGVNEKEMMELPGLTLSFKFDLSGSQEIAHRRNHDDKEVSSPVGTGWRRPHLSQRRTRERLRCVLSVCSTYKNDQSEGLIMKKPSDNDLNNAGNMSGLINESSSPEAEESAGEDKQNMDDVQFHGIFRDFDFLNEIEENDGESTDNFNTGMQWNTSNSSAGASTERLNDVDEPPDECDLTPAVGKAAGNEDDEEEEFENDSEASFSSSSQELQVTEPSSNEFLATGSDEQQQGEDTSTEKLNKAKSLSLSKPAHNTYIRASSPSPPEFSLPSEGRIFSMQRNITEQVNAGSSDTESAYSDENPSTDELNINDLTLSFAASPGSPSKTTIQSDKDRSSASFESIEQRWKANLLAVAEDMDGSAISKFFLVFPSIYRCLCVDFSLLSKDGCNYLGNQLASISNHFSTMVNDLPKQLECPLCLATQKTYVILMKQLKLYVADLEDQLDFYANKQEDAYGCLEVVTSLYDKSREGSGEPLTVDKREELDLKQLELCRLLYTLHFQLLLIFQSFNRLIHAVATSLPQDGKTPDKMIALHKQLLSYEKTKDSPSYNSTAAEELIDAEDDLKSMTNEEALNVLNASLQGSEYKTSQLQLGLLRKLWPMEPFGCQYDSGADFLTSLYFEKSVGAKTDGAAYVIIGENSGSRDLCEKLMEVNMQIQHTLQVLEKPRPHNSSVNESHTKSESSATSSNSHSAQKTSFKKTSF